MSQTPILAARDINSRAELHSNLEIPVKTGNAILDANLYDLSRRFCGDKDPDTVLQLLATVMNAAQSGLESHDLEIMNSTLDELFAAEKMFMPYANTRKVTCFGSARIRPDDPIYKLASDFAKLCADNGFMVITGGGPGIMQACNEGATGERSFGLNITLPFEQAPNPAIAGSDHLMNFHYFFTRKLNLIKQSDALVALPGGFGTMDEIYESITLIQTGKATIFPIILLDTPEETFWKRWYNFVFKELLEAGLISKEDMFLLYPCKSAEAAYQHIARFYSRFHSYYFQGDQVVIRMNRPLTGDSMEWLQHDFQDIIAAPDLQQMENDGNDPQPVLAPLPRISFSFARRNFARLRQMIDAINDGD
ncbi:MAG: LOG family protein [Akkermansia sp.]|nr:LOG family protein [Akkermansia sp.]